MKKRSRNKTRSILSLILSLALVLGMCTASYAAEEIPDGEPGEEAVVETDTTAEDTLEEGIPAEETQTEDTEGSEYITEDFAGETEEYPADEISGYDEETLSADETEDIEEEEPEIQVFAATEGDQTLKVVQKAEGTIGDDVSFTYHLYKITDAAETIENMGDIISYEPGASLEYVIVDTDTGEEVSTETTDGSGAFAIHVGETAEFTLEADTNWFVNQETPDAYPLVSVGSDGEYADVVGGTNGVVYYGQIEPEPVAPEISGLTVTSDLEGNEKTYDGGSVTLTAGATVTPDTAAVSYQWYKDGVEISGATGSTYTLAGSVYDTGTYKCVVTAENDDLTASAEAEVTVIINKAAQNISYAVTEMEKALGDESFTNVLTETTVSKDDGAGITYSSSDESVATVNAETGEVTILALGEVTITATAAATENYEEATASYTLTVREQPVINGLTITSNLTGNEKTYDGDEVTLTANTEYIPDTAEITYQWYVLNEEGDYSEINGADEENLTLVGNVSDSGTYKCVVTVTNDGLTTSEEAEITITINKAEQDISYEESTVTKVDYDEPFIIDLTKTTVYGSISYTSSDESVATVDPDTGEVTIVGTGYTTITATAAETDNYKEATASYVLTVNEDVVEWEIDVNNQQVTWDEDSGEWVDDLTYTGESLELEMAITLTEEEQEELVGITYQWYRYNAETLGFDKIEGATEDAYTLEDEDVNAGDYIYMCVAVVTYKNNIDHTVYGPIEVIIEKADQSIVFEEESLEAVAGDTVTNEIMKEDSVIYGDVTYTSSDESIATVDEETGEVTIVGVGTVTITATAAETENYNAVSAEYTITTSDEVSVTVTSDMDDEDNTKTYDGKEVTLTAKASSKVDGVTYTYQWYTVDESGTETEIEDATEDALTLDGNAADSGTYKCTVTVNYPNDAEPATVSDIIEITINKAPQDISYEETEIEKTTADEPFTNELKETTVSDEEGAGITYSSSDETVATVDEDGMVTIVAVGEVTITATAAATDNYEEATASYTLVVTEESYNVKYAVVIYGINQDVDADGYILGLTFGPATGASYISTYKAHLTEEQYAAGEGICLHWMSWEEIIEQSKKDPTVFQACLENGCTHSVNLTLNDKLLDTDYSGQMDDGDGAGYLYNSINSNYRMWNSGNSNTGGWPASQVRAVFNGKDDQTGSYATYALDASDCLFSCFPSVLQDAIAAKAVKSDTVYNSQTEADNKTTYDKLWLFSGKELYGDSGSHNNVIRTYEGELYQRSTELGITTSNYGGLSNYNETGGNSWWWLRSPYTGSDISVYYVNASGNWVNGTGFYTGSGLAPGFCLAGPGVKQPAINGVTITSGLTDNNVKTYDGDEVALTAVADYTPDTATITYQWYKKNDAGEYTEIEGEDEETLTLDGNVSDTGTYKCEVTITYGGFNTSDYAEITITINVAGQDISYEKTEIQKTTAAGAFTNPLTETFVDPNGQITYASSDETVATVDAETGEVTIVSDGEVTITATAAATANCTEATASYTLTVKAKTWDSVQYAVKLWGICTDTYSYDEGSTLQTASLTFGPATGADHLNSYVSCDSDTCIHKLSWDEIISLCEQNQGNESALQSLFGSCLEKGCTKAVELTLNDTLFNMTAVNNALEQGYTGDGVSMLYYLLNGTGSTDYLHGANWNKSYTGYSSSDPANIYSRSRIRATLTGDSADAKAQVAAGRNDYYGVDTLCDESNCLLSCFPEDLQAAVVPRTTLNTGNATSGTSANDKTTYDKLFLYSLKETGITDAYDDGGGSDYGVNPTDSDRIAYEFSDTSAKTSSSHYWYSRSRYSRDTYSACTVISSGSGSTYNVFSSSGLSPGFCIK